MRTSPAISDAERTALHIAALAGLIQYGRRLVVVAETPARDAGTDFGAVGGVGGYVARGLVGHVVQSSVVHAMAGLGVAKRAAAAGLSRAAPARASATSSLRSNRTPNQAASIRS